MEKKPLKIEELGPEKLPPRPRAATTSRPISEESRRIITAAQAEAIRRARRR
jgi:hypothetical protein